MVLHHTGGLVGPLAVLKPVAAMGWSGVGLFLVLSGFSIHFRWAASDVPHHDFTYGKFVRRRFFRLYPTYLAAIAVAIGVAFLLGSIVNFGVPWVFAHGDTPIAVGLATQGVLVVANIVHVPYISVAWSLGLEAQLYAMYAVIVRRLRTIGVVRIVVWAFVVTVAWRVGSQLVTTSMPIGQFFPDGHSSELSRLLYVQLPARCFEWLLGVLAAEMYFGRVKLPVWARSLWIGAALLAVAAVVFRHPVGQASLNGHPFLLSDVVLDQLLGLGYFVVLLAAVHREGWTAKNRIGGPIVRALAVVGIFSYSLYLLHPEMLRLAGRILSEVGVGGVASTLGRWVFTLVMSWLFYRAIERHFIDGRVDRWTAAKWAGRRSARASV